MAAKRCQASVSACPTSSGSYSTQQAVADGYCFEGAYSALATVPRFGFNAPLICNALRLDGIFEMPFDNDMRCFEQLKLMVA